MMIIFITIRNLLELRKGAIIKWFNTESRKDTEHFGVAVLVKPLQLYF